MRAVSRSERPPNERELLQGVGVVVQRTQQGWSLSRIFEWSFGIFGSLGVAWAIVRGTPKLLGWLGDVALWFVLGGALNAPRGVQMGYRARHEAAVPRGITL